MKKIAVLSLFIVITSTRLAFAKVIFLPGNTQQGNGNNKGAVVCVQKGIGVITGCSNFTPTSAPGHSTSNLTTLGDGVDDAGGWLYHDNVADPSYGLVQVNCAHPDQKGVSWLNY